MTHVPIEISYEIIVRCVKGIGNRGEHEQCTHAFRNQLFITDAFVPLRGREENIARISQYMQAGNSKKNGRKKGVFIYGPMSEQTIERMAGYDEYVELHDIVKLDLLLRKILEAVEYGRLPAEAEKYLTQECRADIRQAVANTTVACVYPAFNYAAPAQLATLAAALGFPTVHDLAVGVFSAAPQAPPGASLNTLLELSHGRPIKGEMHHYKCTDRLTTFLLSRSAEIASAAGLTAPNIWIRDPRAGPAGSGRATLGLKRTLGNEP